MSRVEVRGRLQIACASFLAWAAFGVRFMAPSVSFGDSGEFIASAATLSIPHAPGFPLYCLWARALGSVLPLGSWAYRANLFSVLCAAGALTLMLDAALLAGISLLGACIGVLFLGLNPFWLHASLQAEVFALNSLMAAAGIWIVCRSRGRLDARWEAALGLCLGLGLANHQMLLFAVPALLAESWSGWAAPEDAGKALTRIALFAALGFSAYLYLPIRSRFFPPLDWGHPVDLGRFLRVLLRKDYGSFSLTVEGAAAGRLLGSWLQLKRYVEASLRGFGAAGLGLAVLGAAGWRRSQGTLSWRLPALLVLFSGPGFLWLGNPPFDALTTGALARFYLLSWLGVFFWLASGAALIESLFRPAAWALALVPLLAAGFGPEWSRRWDLAPYDYGSNLLRSLPAGARLFIDGGDDAFYTLAYLQYAERRRADVDIHDRGGLVFRNIYGPDFRRLAKEAKEDRRLAAESISAGERPTFYATLRDDLLPGRRLLLSGLLRRIGPADPNWREEGEVPQGRALWALYPIRLSGALSGDYRYRSLVPIYAVMRSAADSERGDFPSALKRLGEAAQLGGDALWLPGTLSHQAQWAGFRASRRADWRSAEEAYRLALAFTPAEATARLNWGVALERLGRLKEAEDAYRRAAESSGSARAYYDLGALCWSAGRWSEAARMFEEALSREPANLEYRLWRGKALRRSRA